MHVSQAVDHEKSDVVSFLLELCTPQFVPILVTYSDLSCWVCYYEHQGLVRREKSSVESSTWWKAQQQGSLPLKRALRTGEKPSRSHFAGEKASRSRVPEEDSIECRPKGKKVSICHYDRDQDLFVNKCVATAGGSGHMKRHEKNYYGEFIETVVFRFVDFLDTVSSPSEALNTVDQRDLNRFVKGVRSFVDDDLKNQVTPQGVLEVFFPHPDAVVDFSDRSLQQMKLRDSNAIALPIRDLGLYSECDEFFDALPEDSCEAAVQLVAGVLAVIFSFMAIPNARAVSMAVAQHLVQVGRTTSMFSQLLGAIELSVILRLPLSTLNFGIKLANSLVKAFGLKMIWKGLKESLSPYEVLLGGTSMLLTLTALCMTGWPACANIIAGCFNSVRVPCNCNQRIC